MKKAKVGLWSLLTSISAILMVIVFIGSSIAQNYATVINVHFDIQPYEVVKSDSSEDTEYFKSDFATKEELKAYEEELCKTVEGEGAALLKNENAALPLAKGAKVSLFSRSSTDLVYGGAGSGAVDTSTAAKLDEAMEGAGFQINRILWDFYSSEEITTNYPRLKPIGWLSMTEWDMDMYDKTTVSFGANEVPWSMVTEAAGESFAEYGDAAIMVLSRAGGEGSDLPCGDNGSGVSWFSGVDGNYLQLSPEEQETLAGLKALKDQGVFKKIIVLINSSNALEVDFLNPEICGVDYGVDAAMWIGDVGQFGILGVAELLCGDRVPSGSLVATYCYDNLTSPAIKNAYSYLYTNWEEMGLGYGNVSTDWGEQPNYNITNMYNVYQEGIYVGYRYYETRYEDVVMGTGNAGSYDYNKTVAYPFGYGLSYTDFAYSNFKAVVNEDTFEITVDVTNIGDTYSGKKTVQVYFQSPYTQYDKENGIEKASVELCGYAKTDILAPGQTETVTIVVDKEELRTYDSNNAKTYILDAGDYYFTVADGAHEAVNNVLAAKGYTVENTEGRMDADGDVNVTFKWTAEAQDNEIFATSSVTGNPITNLFDNADPNKAEVTPGEVTWVSRSDWEGTFPEKNVIYAATQEMVDGLAYSTYNPDDYEDMEMPTMGADNGLTLAKMIGADYDDPEWENLLDQATFDEMVQVITLAYHNTAAMPSVAKPATKDENGPMGMTASLTGGEVDGTAYPSEDIMAATFNDELAYEIGKCIGEDALAGGYSGLYGPGVNIHRTPYSGRNFEYYSEDPFISANFCAEEVKGVQDKGVYVYLKHFALNDQESYRMGCCNWVNEQAAREIYLEAFEAPVTDGKAIGVMNSFSRWGLVWAGAHKGLQTDLLRGEWGMEGINLTDMSAYSDYMNIIDGLLAGTNAWDSSSEEYHTTRLKEFEDDAVVVNAMREATHRILYSVANSNAMNGMSPNDMIKLTTPWWEAALIALKVVTVVSTVVCAAMLFLNIKRKKETK